MDLEKMTKKRNFWLGASMLFLGIAVGYLIAPAKKGINIKNICGNGWGENDCIDADCYSDDDCCDDKNPDNSINSDEDIPF